MTEPSEMVNVRYMVDDVQASVDFYVQHLGFDVRTSAAPAFADITRGNLRLLISGPQSSAGRPMSDGETPRAGGWNRIHFVVDDLEAEIKRLRDAGLTFRNDVVTGPGGAQVLLAGVAHLDLEVDHLLAQLLRALAQVVRLRVARGQRGQLAVEVGEVLLQALEVARARLLAGERRRPGLLGGGRHGEQRQGGQQHGDPVHRASLFPAIVTSPPRGRQNGRVLESGDLVRALRALLLYTGMTVAFTWPLPALVRTVDAGDAAFFPRDPSVKQELLDLYTLDKVLHEVQYELDHRPDWLWIPLDGFARLAQRLAT